jgi:hypothetical protein
MEMKMKIKLFIISIFIFSNLQAQYQNVLIADYGSMNEPSIYINPKNPLEIMGGANIDNYFYSEDGGYTWQVNVLESPSYGVWGDPMIITDTTGNFYFFHLSNPSVGNWIDRIVCQKYNKLNGTWNDGSFMGLNGSKAQDKHWAIVDQNTNAIYVTWTQFDDYGSGDPFCQSNIMFSKSTDEGLSWSSSKKINLEAGDCIDSDNTVEGAVPAVGPNGEIYVAWSGPGGIVFNKSIDAGETWLSNEIFVCEQGGGWDLEIPGISRSNGLPVTVCDLSNGPNRGTIYVNYTDQINGSNDTDVWLVKSTDGGETWSVPVRVNDDPPGKHQFFTWMAIDQSNGYLYFVFYDRRNYSNNQTDVYLAVSPDGGAGFSNFVISESPFSPYSGVFFGDYNNISVVNNMVRPIWTRNDSGDLSIYTAIIDMSVGIQEKDPTPASIEQNYPNPFIESTVFSYKITRSGKVKLSVINQMGEEIIVLKDEFLVRGKYTYSFDTSEYHLSPGVYYFNLLSNNKSFKRKMVIANH